MVELYVEDLKKSIEELELDKELEKYVNHHLGKTLEAFGTILSRKTRYCCCHFRDARATSSSLASMV